MLWVLSSVSQNAWGHGCQTLSAVEKLPQKSVTNKGRKRKELCLPVNEAKNGKRVWCRSGTQPAFSKWGRLKFPTSSQCKTTFKTTRPPTPRLRALSSSQDWKGSHPVRITKVQLFRNCLDRRKRGGKMGEGGKRPTASFDLWASHAKLKKQKQNIKLFTRIPGREVLQEPSATNSTFHLNLKVYEFPEVTDVLQFTVT